MKINRVYDSCPTFGELEPGTVFKFASEYDGDPNDVCMKLCDVARWNNDPCEAVELTTASPMYIRGDVEVVVLNAELNIK